jgi:DNA-binding LytR/AlgR family response regulator
MKLKTALCDDEDIGIELLCQNLDYYHFETGIEFEKNIYKDPRALLNDYQKIGHFDIIFLDVEMPISGIMHNGLDIAKSIRSIPDNDVRIIFISNYPSYMQMGYDVQASYYLEKNVSREKFKRVLDSIIEKMQKDQSMIRIKTDRNQWDLVRISDIIYVRSFSNQRNKTLYCTNTRDYLEEGRSILSISSELSAHGFAFANKHYLINMQHVRQFTHDCMQLDNKEYIEISRHYRKDFLGQFSRNILRL